MHCIWWVLYVEWIWSDRWSSSWIMLPLCCCLYVYIIRVDIDNCMNNPCRHGGNCTDRVDDFFCTCPHGYTGATCETGRPLVCHTTTVWDYRLSLIASFRIPDVEQPTTEPPSTEPSSTEQSVIENTTTLTDLRPTTVANTTYLVTTKDEPTSLVAGAGEEELQRGDFAAIGVGACSGKLNVGTLISAMYFSIFALLTQQLSSLC